jgi:hypothetical protein
MNIDFEGMTDFTIWVEEDARCSRASCKNGSWNRKNMSLVEREVQLEPFTPVFSTRDANDYRECVNCFEPTHQETNRILAKLPEIIGEVIEKRLKYHIDKIANIQVIKLKQIREEEIKLEEL